MNRFRQRLDFLFRYAWADLLDGKNLLASLAVVVNVAILCGVGLAGFALAGGYEQVQHHRIRQAPQARSLWLGDPHGGPTLDAELRQQLLDRLRAQQVNAVCIPYHEVNIDWFVLPDQPATRTTTLRGRTVAANDPILSDAALPLRADSPGIAGTNGTWVIVSADMLPALNADKGQLPRVLRIRNAFDEPFEVGVAGVARDGLPFEYQFLLSEQADRLSRTLPPDEELPSILAGPVPSASHDPRKLPEKARQQLADFTAQLQLFPIKPEQTPGGQRGWLLHSMGDPPRLSTWRARLRQLHENLKHDGLTLAEGLQPLGLVEIAVPPPARPGPYRAGIFVDDVKDLRKVETEAQSLGIPLPDRGVLPKLEGYAHSVAQAQTILFVLLGLFGVIAFINTAVLQKLACQMKQAEVGMLKAMGISGRLLWAVYLTESLLLWLVGLAGGILLTWALGWTFVGWIAETPQERGMAFQPSWQLLLAALVVSAAFCLLGLLVPILDVYRRSPARMMAGE